MKDIFDQDEVVYPFKDSYHEPGFSQLVQEVESQKEIAISLNSEYTEVKGVSRWEAPTSPDLLLIDEEHIGPGNPPPQVST